MTANNKISQAFEPLFSEDAPRKRRSAIVIFDNIESNLTIKTRRQRTSEKSTQAKETVRQKNRDVFDTILHGYLSERVVQRVEEKDVPIRRRLNGSGILPLATVEVTAGTIHVLAKQPQVLAILPNQNVHLVAPTIAVEKGINDIELLHHMTWGLQRLNIREFWEQAGTRGEGIKVGVLDTGVYGDHSILKGKIKDFTIIDPTGRRLKMAQGGTFDYHRHGTHVCGIIAGGETNEGVAIGVAPDVKLAVAQIHFGERSFLSSVMDGVDWAVTMGADVINMSIGMPYYDDKIDEFFRLLIENDIAPIVAIGNNAHGSTSCPGNASHTLGVGAVQKSNGTVEIAPFSGGGSLDFPGNELSHVIKPDVVAPGVDICSCVPSTSESSTDEYRFMDGTSMAAPHVAGIVAILMAACPKASVMEIFQAVCETAEHPRGAKLRPDNRWGHGMINPFGALDLLRKAKST